MHCIMVPPENIISLQDKDDDNDDDLDYGAGKALLPSWRGRWSCSWLPGVTAGGEHAWG